jgi:hypothetical protein
MYRVSINRIIQFRNRLVSHSDSDSVMSHVGVTTDGGIGFIGHLYTRLGTTGSCNATANLHNSQITTAPG